MDIALVVIRLALAGVFGVAAVAKLTDRAGFRRALGLGPVQQIGFTGAVLIGCLLASQGYLLLQLMRQNGRLLERVVGVEHALGVAPWQRDSLPRLSDGNGANGHHHHGRHIGHRTGPRVGETAPPVCLPDLTGAEVDLADFRGEPTVLLFWSPRCGYCQQMLPELAAWEADRPEGDTAPTGPRKLSSSTPTAPSPHRLRWVAPLS